MPRFQNSFGNKWFKMFLATWVNKVARGHPKIIWVMSQQGLPYHGCLWEISLTPLLVPLNTALTHEVCHKPLNLLAI